MRLIKYQFPKVPGQQDLSKAIFEAEVQAMTDLNKQISYWQPTGSEIPRKRIQNGYYSDQSWIYYPLVTIALNDSLASCHKNR